MWLKVIKTILRPILWPPFPIVLALSAACLVAFVAWVYFDPWFAMIFEFLKPVPSGPGEVTSLDPLRPTFQTRISIFVTLRILAVAVTALAVIRMFVGSRLGRSLAAWLAMMALLGAWLGFVFSYERIKDAGFRSRIASRIDDLQSLAEALRTYQGQWQSIETSVGTYIIDPVNVPNTFYLKTEQRWWTHTDPRFILRLNDGGLLMLISGWNRFFVEYHPDKNRPSVEHIPSNHLPFGSKFAELSHREAIGEGWFLTAYDE